MKMTRQQREADHAAMVRYLSPPGGHVVPQSIEAELNGLGYVNDHDHPEAINWNMLPGGRSPRYECWLLDGQESINITWLQRTK